jgi:GR25 family glycosyltransferase involved in LPS biosynthesis
MNLINPDYNNLKTFVINLNDYIENYNKQKPYLEEVGLKVERFSGINALKDEHLNLKYKSNISNFAKNFSPKSVIGCALSHILCCKYIYNTFIKSYNESVDNNFYKFFRI